MLVLPNNGGEGGSVDIIDGLESSDRNKSLSANQGKVLNEKIESLKQSVGSGKNVLAKAVTDMGIPTLADYSFEDIARNISLINKATFLDTEFTRSTTVNNTVSTRMNVKSIKGKTLIVDANGNEVVAGTEGARLLSVGQDNQNKIEILSKNSLICNSILWEVGSIDGATGSLSQTNTRLRYKNFSEISSVHKKLYYEQKGMLRFAIRFYDSEYCIINGVGQWFQGFLSSGEYSIPDNAMYYKLVCSKLDDSIIIANEITNNTCVMFNQSNKKEILLSEPLRGINTDICDEIAYLDETDINVSQGKGLYHIKRCDERPYQAGDESNSNVVTDMTNTVYQLDSPIVTKINDIEIYSHEEQTNISINGGAIPVTSTIGVGVNISATLNSLNNQVKSLSEETVKYAITQNRLTLTTRYQADNANFKVDYTGIKSPNIESTDTDLYKLLEDNIAIGKENYNCQEMLEIIDFYAINGLITWDMWDVLWLMIDKQQNPENYQDEIVEVPNETPEI